MSDSASSPKFGQRYSPPCSGSGCHRPSCCKAASPLQVPLGLRQQDRTMTQVIKAQALGKSYGSLRALDAVNIDVEAGRIVGLIGPNGAGKTTALKAILGLIPFEGELVVMGKNPYTERDSIMRDVCFIADVAVMPRWLRVHQALDFVAAVQPS